MTLNIAGLVREAARPQVWLFVIIIGVCIANLGSELQPVLLMVGIWGIAGVGLGLVLGFAGQISLCQAAFVGVGAYTYAILTTELGAPSAAAVAGAAIASALLAVLVSPILRIRGYYLAIATIVLNLLLSALAITGMGVPGGSSGLAGVPYLEVLGFRFETVEDYAGLSLAVLVVLSVAAYLWYGRGHRWRAIQALRHDEGLASGVGLNVVGIKRELFTVSGAAAGLAGAILAAAFGFISPGQFSYAQSFALALAVFIGGSLSLRGAILGVALLEVSGPLLGEYGALHGLLVGVIALLTVRFAPEGWISRRENTKGEAADQVRQELATLHQSDVHDALPDLARTGAAGADVHTARLSRSFGSLHAVRNVTVRFEPGRVVGLIGPNGAGKTTLLNLIAGELRPTSGTIHLDDRPVTFTSPHRLARLGVVRTYQQSRIITGLSVLDNILLGTDALRAAGAGTASRSQTRALALQAAEEAGAVHLLSKPTSSLTFGERRLVELARLLVSRPRLALLDEPFAGLSHNEGEAVGAVIRTLRACGTTVVLVEHAIPFVLSLADELVVLHQGSVLASGAPETVIGLDTVRDSYLGSVVEEVAS